jgi:hypothetical protein
LHVRRHGDLAKFWIRPVRLADSQGFDARALAELAHVIAAHESLIARAWDEHFGQIAALR